MQEFKIIGLNKTIRTSEDWKAICDQYESAQPCAEENGYKYNIHNVCLNPKKPIQRDEKTFKYCVKVCQYNGRYFVASDATTNTGGYGGGCMIDGKSYATEKEALKDELKYLIHWFECAKIPKAVKALQTDLFNLVYTQLEFNFN